MIQKSILSDEKVWFDNLTENPSDFPFSFTYGGKEFHGFPSDICPLVGKSIVKDDKKITARLTFAPDSTLHITLNFSFYPSYGACEWTVYFENTGKTDSEIISDVKSTLLLPGEHPVLRGILGDHENLYRPYEKDLTAEPVRFISDSGRPTHVNFPYFNLEHGDGGAFLVIGWAGTWTADFTFDGEKTVYTASSVNGIHTRLHPDERIRTALFVKFPYAGRDENEATNLWRRWFIDCNLPKNTSAGDSLRPFSTCCLASDTGLPNSDGSISERSTTWKPSFEKMEDENIHVDYRWFDAGWYTDSKGQTVPENWWGTVGSWELDPVKWPGKTFKESVDYARAHGMRTLMWFEPERVTNPEALEANFGYKAEWAVRRPEVRAIVNNIGNPACLRWTTERICKVLSENGVDMYREDNNSNPSSCWRYEDELEGDDRCGITECLVVAAHYKMWDDIIACTLSYGGNGFVDSCASGGGRNDLESLRRGIPILRSDNDRTTTSLRLSMTSSFCKWIPFCGANTKEKKEQLDKTGVSDVYVWRASYLPVLNVDSQYTQDPTQNFDMLRFGLSEWAKIKRFLLCDFYPLTKWHSQDDKTGFTAFAYNDAETGEGVLQVFRMEDCTESDFTLRLPFCKTDKIYTLTDEDTKEKIDYTGETILQGVCITLSAPRSARILWICEK